MTNAGAISAQHPKNVGVVVWIMERRSKLFKKVRRMAWRQTKWPIEPPKDPAPNNFFEIVMVQVLNST
jgi:hypothetical protein